MKKQTTKPSKDSQIEELTKSQIYLYQLCNSMLEKNADLELRLEHASAQINILEKNDESLRKILEVIGDKLKDLKKQLSDGNGEQDQDDEDEEQEDNTIVFAHPMHDDVTVKCEVCDKVFHARIKKCPNCGFNRFEKDR